jgi:hypothetical protein
MFGIYIQRSVCPVRKMLSRADDPIVLYPNLFRGRMTSVFFVSLGEYQALDSQPVHMPDEDGHALFGCGSRQCAEMAVNVPDSEGTVQIENRS